MFTVENINVEDEYQLEREGWTRSSFPAFRDDDGLISVSGWAKGPFGVFVREFIDDDAGRISAASAPRPACGGAMLTLLRLPVLPVSGLANGLRFAPAHTPIFGDRGPAAPSRQGQGERRRCRRP
jgi:hypothetical protein